jgi:trigger factor
MQYAVKERTKDWMDVSFQLSAAELNQKSEQIQARLKQKPSAEDLAKMLRQASMREALQTFLQKEGVVTWGLPRFKVMQQAPANGLAFITRLALLPEVQLPAYQDVQLEVAPVPMPTNDAVEAELFKLKYLLSQPLEVSRPVEWGDIVEMGFLAFDSQEQPIPLSARARESVIVNGALFYSGFMAKLVGTPAGQSFEIQIDAPEDYFHPPVRNQKIIYRGTVFQVFEPQHVQSDQDLLERLDNEFPSIEALFTGLAEDVLLHNQVAWKEDVRQAVVTLVCNNTEISLPEDLLQAECRSEWERLEQHTLRELNQSEAVIEQSWQAWQASPHIQEQVSERLKKALVMRQIALEQSLEVDLSEVVATLMAVADTFDGPSPEELYTELRRRKRLEQWVAQMESEKAVDYLFSRTTLICNGEVLMTPAESESTESL